MFLYFWLVLLFLIHIGHSSSFSFIWSTVHENDRPDKFSDNLLVLLMTLLTLFQHDFDVGV